MDVAQRVPLLAQEWDQLMNAWQVPPGVMRSQAFEQLVVAYSETHRRYHNLEHIEHLLYALADVRTWIKQPDLLGLAIWYHDAVYDPSSSNNESRSADLARTTLSTLGLNPDVIARVCELILMTRNHQAPPDDTDAHWFLDFDLEILGSEPESYRRYVAAIRAEYDWVNDRDFYQGRRRVMATFLERPAIFLTEYDRRRLETKARVNIVTEIAQIDEILRTL